MCVGSWAHFTLSRRAENRVSFGKSRVARLCRTALLVRVGLEIEPQAKLHATPIVCVGHMEEVARTKVCVDRIELRMIEEVKVFPAEVESGLLVNGEFLEKAEVEIEASRQSQCVASDCTERKAFGNGKSRRVVRERATLRGILV